jgi:hypothetical protein
MVLLEVVVHLVQVEVGVRLEVEEHQELLVLLVLGVQQVRLVQQAQLVHLEQLGLVVHLD